MWCSRAGEALDAAMSRLGSLDPRSLMSSLRRVGRLVDAAGLLTQALGLCPGSVSPCPSWRHRPMGYASQGSWTPHAGCSMICLAMA